MAARNWALPPEKAYSGWFSSDTMSMSVVRVDRTGPTTPVSRDCQTQAKRVIPPSTCSSKHTSAVVRPLWGRASGSRLSIFTTSAGLVSLAASGWGRPVSGAVGGPAGAVVVGAAGTVCAEGVVAGAVAAGRRVAGRRPLPEHAAARTAAARSGPASRRRPAPLGLTGSQFPERLDALVERRVGLEQPGQRREPAGGWRR